MSTCPSIVWFALRPEREYYGRGASRATLERRARLGGRKGRRAARRLRVKVRALWVSRVYVAVAP